MMTSETIDPQNTVLGVNETNKRAFMNRRNKIRNKFFGNAIRRGWIATVVIYFLLLSIGFVYLQPLLHMFSTSMMSLTDILDSSIRWIPSGFYYRNFRNAFLVMNYMETLFQNFIIAGIPALAQTFICSLTAYGFARFKFKGKTLLMGIMIFTFIVPPQILMMPTFLLYTDLGLVGSLWAFIMPASLGQGFQSAIMILIFYQFYKPIPEALTEAAEIDGASQVRIYWSLGVRSALPAVIVVFLLSFVFYWNETHLTGLYLGLGGGGNSDWTTLLIELDRFRSSFNAVFPAGMSGEGNRLNEGVTFAGTLLAIAPLIFMAGFLQKFLVESIDGAGITGE